MEVGAIKSTLNSVIQKLKRLSLKIDDRNLADDTYRSGWNHSSINIPPPPSPLNPPHQPPPAQPSSLQPLPNQPPPLQSPSYQPPPIQPHPNQPPPRYPLRNPQFDEFSDEEELGNPVYQYDDFEDEYGDEGMAYGRWERFANPNLNKRDGFPNPNRKAKFSYPNHDRKWGYTYPNEYRMKVEISSFSRNLDIESFLNWIYEVEKFFDMTYFSI